MLYHGNSALTTRLAAFCLILLVLGPVTSHAQTPDEANPQPEPAAQAPIATPSLGAAIEAYRQLEPWVRGLEVPDNAPGPDVVGACVTLRFEGRVIGIGSVYGAGQRSVPEAARLAIADARSKLPVMRDAMASERLRVAAEQMAISLEIAGPGVPLGAGSYEHVAALFQPGVHGVALRIDDYASAVFPGEMLWMRQEPAAALQRLIASMTGDVALSLRPLEEVLQAENISVLRFETVHVAQPTPASEAQVIQRGGELVLTRDIASVDGLQDWANGLAQFLIRMDDTGTYNPIAGSASEQPNPFESALRMYALYRFSKATNADSLSREARVKATEIAESLLHLIGNGQRIGAPADALLVVSFADGLTYDAQYEDARQRLPRALNSMASKIDQFPPPERAMIAWALAELGEDSTARGALSAAKAEGVGQYPGLMPWLGYAELSLADDGEIPSAVALRQMRALMWDHQLTYADIEGLAPELQGGIVFTRGRNPAPTWAAARPLAFVARMLGEGELTPREEIPSEMAKLIESLRFLRQLSAGPLEGHMYRDPAGARWGTRSAIWDQTMPISASSMSLLTVVETLESLEAVRSRPEP